MYDAFVFGASLGSDAPEKGNMPDSAVAIEAEEGNFDDVDFEDRVTLSSSIRMMPERCVPASTARSEFFVHFVAVERIR
jgi:hypothetical protein